MFRGRVNIPFDHECKHSDHCCVFKMQVEGARKTKTDEIVEHGKCAMCNSKVEIAYSFDEIRYKKH